MTSYHVQIATPGCAASRNWHQTGQPQPIPADDPCERGARFSIVDEDGCPLIDFELETEH